MKKLLTLVLMISTITFTGCGKNSEEAATKDTTPVIVKINDSVITKGTFDKVVDMAFKNSFLAQNNANPKELKNNPMMIVLKNNVINELISKELLIQEAEKRKIEVSDKEIDEAIDKISQNAGGKEKLEATLTLNGVSKKDFNDNIKFQLTIKKLVEKLAVNVNPSDKEAKDFYDKNKSTKFVYPDLVRAQHILISASAQEIATKLQSENADMAKNKIEAKINDEITKAKTKADKILTEVKAKPSEFDKLAQKYSEDPTSATKGGDLGFFKADQMVPSFSKVAFSLTPGKVSDVVQSEFGFHIIKVTDRKKAGVTPFIEVKEEIKKYLGDAKKMEMLEKILVGAKNSAKIVYVNEEYNPETMKKELKEATKNSKGMMPAQEKAAK